MGNGVVAKPPEVAPTAEAAAKLNGLSDAVEDMSVEAKVAVESVEAKSDENNSKDPGITASGVATKSSRTISGKAPRKPSGSTPDEAIEIEDIEVKGKAEDRQQSGGDSPEVFVVVGKQASKRVEALAQQHLSSWAMKFTRPR